MCCHKVIKALFNSSANQVEMAFLSVQGSRGFKLLLTLN
uniref:Uncharacterized protein n=1 Tax=Anguilla anguilla TaxID=7936 RepID=A0A0E9S963_ANGAN